MVSIVKRNSTGEKILKVTKQLLSIFVLKSSKCEQYTSKQWAKYRPCPSNNNINILAF